MSRRKRRAAMRNAARRNRGHKIEIDYRKVFKSVGGWIILIMLAAVLGYSVVAFGGQTITNIGQSMEPVLEDGDVVFVNKFAYKIGKPERYDVVAYKLRRNDEYYNIKRVIGLPGEKVQIVDGQILINGAILKDVPFDDIIMTAGLAEKTIVLANNEYFLLGDNVNNSEDSRFENVGNVLTQELLGRVDSIVSPKDRKRKVK